MNESFDQIIRLVDFETLGIFWVFSRYSCLLILPSLCFQKHLRKRRESGSVCEVNSLHLSDEGTWMPYTVAVCVID
ncbi:hypothetical protein VNO80_07651 [Phaseolus coccineus]|uniref:Uncharacterized protein n=1 Tax=Phaseolus coccineus TaxID=3886 RepID=A0AAN9RJT6_PHACN